jgi:DNA-binding NtrC family response regulator
LQGKGYEVHAAPDGKAGMDLVHQYDIDLVFTDLSMPNADGMALLRHIRDVSPQTLVIMTAHATVDTAVEAIRLGAQDYLLKPLILRMCCAKCSIL